MNTIERQDLLEEAQNLLREALDMVREATRGTHLEATAESYTLPHLAMLISDDHEWLGSNSGNLQVLIEGLED